MAERDLNEINKYKSTINNVADKKRVHPALIAALISRTSRVGKTLKDGWGCYDENRKAYNTFGLMQVRKELLLFLCLSGYNTQALI